MDSKQTTAQRMIDVGQAFAAGRDAPLSQHFPKLTREYRAGEEKLASLMDDLPTAEVKSPADALAMLTLAMEMFAILHENSSRNEVGDEAAGAMSCALLRLRGGLAEVAGLDASTLDFVRPTCHAVG